MLTGPVAGVRPTVPQGAPPLPSIWSRLSAWSRRYGPVRRRRPSRPRCKSRPCRSSVVAQRTP